jgi:predicted XRE-type DNA-binding protein
MTKSKKFKAKPSNTRWPDEKTLSEIRARLSSDEVQGSTVLGPNAKLVDRIKHNVCSKIVQFHLNSNLSQKELADKLNVDEPEMSRILHYKLERYTIDRLLGYLEILYPKVGLEVFAA